MRFFIAYVFRILFNFSNLNLVKLLIADVTIFLKILEFCFVQSWKKRTQKYHTLLPSPKLSVLLTGPNPTPNLVFCSIKNVSMRDLYLMTLAMQLLWGFSTGLENNLIFLLNCFVYTWSVFYLKLSPFKFLTKHHRTSVRQNFDHLHLF